MQAQGQGLLAVLECANLVVDRAIVGTAAGHALDVAAGAEGLADAGEDDHADVWIRLQHKQDLAQRGRDDIAQRVALLRPVERHGGDVVCHRAQELIRPGVDRPGHHAAQARFRAGRAFNRSM